MVDDPNYNLTITELKNKNGDLHVLGKSYALRSILGTADAVDQDGNATTVAALFTIKTRFPLPRRIRRRRGTKPSRFTPGTRYTTKTAS